MMPILALLITMLVLTLVTTKLTLYAIQSFFMPLLEDPLGENLSLDVFPLEKTKKAISINEFSHLLFTNCLEYPNRMKSYIVVEIVHYKQRTRFKHESLVIKVLETATNCIHHMLVDRHGGPISDDTRYRSSHDIDNGQQAAPRSSSWDAIQHFWQPLFANDKIVYLPQAQKHQSDYRLQSLIIRPGKVLYLMELVLLARKIHKEWPSYTLCGSNCYLVSKTMIAVLECAGYGVAMHDPVFWTHAGRWSNILINGDVKESLIVSLADSFKNDTDSLPYVIKGKGKECGTSE
ncbi:hypothetical protein BDN70DRAFT_931892 [Pholiota conissans]|uniref:Uncharacterized protein n=1 Tax=Pholiota conissans TaxID=109636 RepID=A0A9P5Z6C3_9AGAR|nr:hypothetical protein BDN70DRAFT_931892 [Pholiota conissans]